MDSRESIYARLGLPDAPMLVDARRETDFIANRRMIPGALRGDPADIAQWARGLLRARPVSVYCSDGAGLSASVADKLKLHGYSAAVLKGGLQEWISGGYATIQVRSELRVPGGSRWVTRERPKIDRLACPWLIRRFIDPDALFFYAPAHRVRADAVALAAEPYDMADVTFSHRGTRCSFDAFLSEFDLHDPVLDEIANIVRSADTGELARSPQAPGLLAISLGLATNIADDIMLLEQTMSVYDALYAWCKSARNQTHAWPQR
jgi:rhodanese-related sulfurtransferase